MAIEHVCLKVKTNSTFCELQNITDLNDVHTPTVNPYNWYNSDTILQTNLKTFSMSEWKIEFWALGGKGGLTKTCKNYFIEINFLSMVFCANKEQK